MKHLLLMALFCLNVTANAQTEIKGDLITPEQKAEILQGLQRLKNRDDSNSAEVRMDTPDYAIARATLQKEIARSIQGYLTALSTIDQTLSQTLGRLEALKKQVDQGKMDHNFYLNELKRVIPTTNGLINGWYGQAIDQLYLNESYPVSVAKKHFPGGRAWAGVTQKPVAKLTSPKECVTAVCTQKIAGDLAEWFAYVDGLNEEVDFMFPKQRIITSHNQSLKPFATKALINSLQTLMKGPKTNVSYNVAGYMLEQLKRPVGVVAAPVIAPVFVFEKMVQLVSRLFTTKVIELELKLNRVETYSPSEINEALSNNYRQIAEGQPAALYDDEINHYIQVQTQQTDQDLQRKKRETDVQALIEEYVSGVFYNCSLKTTPNNQYALYVDGVLKYTGAQNDRLINELATSKFGMICKKLN